MARAGTRIAKKNSATIVALDDDHDHNDDDNHDYHHNDFDVVYHIHNDEHNYFASIMIMIKSLFANHLIVLVISRMIVIISLKR